jgi:hypothetical protein
MKLKTIDLRRHSLIFPKIGCGDEVTMLTPMNIKFNAIINIMGFLLIPQYTCNLVVAKILTSFSF